MKETEQLKKLMEAVDSAFAPKSKMNEDWGSSDWYPIIKRIDAAIEQYGLSPETIQDAANEAADFYHDSMGYENSDDAQEAIIDHWKRTSETGQRLMRMFAPVAEGTFSDSRVRNLPGGDRHGPVQSGTTPLTPDEKKAQYDAWAKKGAAKTKAHGGKSEFDRAMQVKEEFDETWGKKLFAVRVAWSQTDQESYLVSASDRKDAERVIKEKLPGIHHVMGVDEIIKDLS